MRMMYRTMVDECCLFYPPNKLGNGRHKLTVMSIGDIKSKKLEQYHYVTPNAYACHALSRTVVAH